MTWVKLLFGQGQLKNEVKSIKIKSLKILRYYQVKYENGQRSRFKCFLVLDKG